MGDLDDLYDLRDEMDRMAQRYEQAERSLEPVSGFDEDGVVTVTLEGDGSFRDVRVTDDWLTYYEPEEIAGVVMTAYTMAASLRLGNWISAAEEAPRPMTRPADTANTPSGRLHEVLRLEHLEVLIARATTEVQAVASQRASAQDRPGRIEATCDSSGNLVSLDIDPEFAERSTGTTLGQSLTTAIRGAIDAAANPSRDALTELTEFVARMQDPQRTAELFEPRKD
ncbi:YbaB/EbfC family nucleoid-associated protein [Microbacterium sediminis]|uniref:YbaB/EbfC family DNA-binding protein n=1 Tax=Microbacterium sediminis TaxID=904291 RepID=A0A1B9NE12_9MICO|nr:YbaB/EbfC family nucleoid-associated protein [Microbacterium sediminis]OCG74813.1 hypothetical protein A7J15_04660 [Microbacterium sediminis]